MKLILLWLDSDSQTSAAFSYKQIDAFKWRSADENDLLDFRRMGDFGDYTGSGFVVDITNLTTVSLVDTLSFLKVWPCSWQPLQARSRDTPA